MTMRDEYRTKAAEFEARARIESDRTTRLHFESLANDYQCLAELADRNEQIRRLAQALEMLPEALRDLFSERHTVRYRHIGRRGEHLGRNHGSEADYL